MNLCICLTLGDKSDSVLKVFTAEQFNTHFDYKEFVDFLQEFYCKEVNTPLRQHYHLDNDPKGAMLVMPSWSDDTYMGVKLVNVFPGNKSVPTINGLYVLMSRRTGEVICQFDGLALTCKRTAAVSALAAKLLSKRTMKSMLMIGTGNMSAELIQAHHSIQQFDEIYIWGRSFEKAKDKAEHLKAVGYPVVAIKDKDAYANKVDLISVATLSEKPLIYGKGLKEHVYVDLVGSYQINTREADDDVLKGAKIYVDTYAAIEESGELKIPLNAHLISREDVLADIIALSKENYVPDNEEGKIVFKSVGFAASDLACGVYMKESTHVN